MSGRWRHERRRARLAADAAIAPSNPMLEAFQVWVRKGVSPFQNGGETPEFAAIFNVLARRPTHSDQQTTRQVRCR
jgi:hypothetical protein